MFVAQVFDRVEFDDGDDLGDGEEEETHHADRASDRGDLDQARYVDAGNGCVDVEGRVQEPLDDEQHLLEDRSGEDGKTGDDGPSLGKQRRSDRLSEDVRQRDEDQHHRRDVDGVSNSGLGRDGQIDGGHEQPGNVLLELQPEIQQAEETEP